VTHWQDCFLTGRTITNSYSYDAGSNRTSATLDGTTVNYGYDTLNRLTNLTSGFAGQFIFGYDALSRRASLNRPNAVNTTYTYDSVSRLLSVLHQLGATRVAHVWPRGLARELSPPSGGQTWGFSRYRARGQKIVWRNGVGVKRKGARAVGECPTFARPRSC
jgi:YD repeat-containing protein